jgi:DNA-binding CsgD family transcriptional regulator
MPGNKKGVKSATNTARTSPASIRLQKRRARALELREQGQSFKAIAAELKCANGTAYNYVDRAIKDTIPTETAQQIIAVEMAKLDALWRKFSPLALDDGDKEAAKLCVRLHTARCRLAGLYPQPGGGGVNVLVNNSGGADAKTLGVRVVFPEWARVEDDEPPPQHWQAPPQRLIEARPERPRFGAETPEQEPPAPTTTPPAANVVRLDSGRERTRAEIEQWVCDGHPNPHNSAMFQPRRGKGDWMR